MAERLQVCALALTLCTSTAHPASIADAFAAIPPHDAVKGLRLDVACEKPSTFYGDMINVIVRLVNVTDEPLGVRVDRGRPGGVQSTLRWRYEQRPDGDAEPSVRFPMVGNIAVIPAKSFLQLILPEKVFPPGVTRFRLVYHSADPTDRVAGLRMWAGRVASNEAAIRVHRKSVLSAAEQAKLRAKLLTQRRGTIG